MILTVAESKRLICKAILEHPFVKKAWTDGIVVIHPSSTTYFILDELGVDLPKENNGLWICGHIRAQGLCLSKPFIELLIGGNYADPHKGAEYPFDLVFKKGVLQTPGPLTEVIDEMGEDDVYVKAVNAVDPEGNLGILLCVAGGGSVGNVIRNKSKGKYKILAATGLEKNILTPIKEAAKLCKGLSLSTGIRTSMTILKADGFISEIEAFQTLTGCKATPVACGGVDGMEGGYVFVLEGTEDELNKAWSIWRELKGSQLPTAPDFECAGCPWKGCNCSPNYDPDFSEGVYQGK
jgi:hypothetical protein